MIEPIVRSVVVAAPAERVFRLLVEPEELMRWWPDAVELEPEVGGRVRLRFADGNEIAGRVTRFDPPRALGFTWTWPSRPGAATQVDFSVIDLGERGCEVTVTHGGRSQLFVYHFMFGFGARLTPKRQGCVGCSFRRRPLRRRHSSPRRARRDARVRVAGAAGRAARLQAPDGPAVRMGFVTRQ